MKTKNVFFFLGVGGGGEGGGGEGGERGPLMPFCLTEECEVSTANPLYMGTERERERKKERELSS